MNQCQHCGNDTRNPRYCSRSCSAKESNKIPKRKKPMTFCKSCSSIILSKKKRTLCDDCLVPKDITLLDAIYDRHHKSSAFALVRSRARASVKNEPQVCEVCSYSKHVEVAHIKPICDFPTSTFLSVINARSNLRLLCPNCHWEFDNL